MPTSAPLAADRLTSRTWWFVYGIWALLTLQMLVFVYRYAQPGPVVDEWEFVPALSDEEPFGPWLWKLHNEHRFPLPRLIWYPITRLSGDYSMACYVSLAGASFLTLLLIGAARDLRGKLHFTDAFFPMSILHMGHWENLRMGYQIVFMMNLLFAGILLWIIVRTNRNNLFPRAVQAGLVTLLLLACGAGGLAFGPLMVIWLTAVAQWYWRATPREGKRFRVLWIVGLAALIPVYILLYLQGYERPSYHPDPVAVWKSHGEALFQAFRSAIQALDMAFGPAGMGLWPASIFVFSLGLLECALLLLRVLAARIEERPRAFGLLLFLASVCFMAFGIGWGRCGFREANGEPGFMAHAARYSWITWPALGAIYYMWMLYGGPRTSRLVPLGLFSTILIMLPFNVVTGFMAGEEHKAFNQKWEKSVREGMSNDELVRTYYRGYYDDARLRKRMFDGLQLLRKNRIQYYRPLPEPRVPKRSRRRVWNAFAQGQRR